MPRILVDIERSLESIWSGFRSNTRNRIRLAEKRGVEIRIGSAGEMETFARLSTETTARRRLKGGNTTQFFLAERVFATTDALRLYLARNEGVDVAGIVVLRCGSTATYVWGASTAVAEGRRLNPNPLLHWTAMQWARERGCATYDLFGIPDLDVDVLEAGYGRRSDGMWNLYRFKRGFGGRVHRYIGTFDCWFIGPVERR